MGLDYSNMNDIEQSKLLMASTNDLEKYTINTQQLKDL